MAEQLVKVKKKQWYPILAPKLFNNTLLGETIVADPQSMIGKTLSNSLTNLANDAKRQNVNVHFKVTEVENDKAKTVVIGYEMINSSVKRLVRRNSEKVDLSFNCETSDNVWLRVKPVVVTRSAVKGTVAARLRRNIVKFATEYVKKNSYEQVLTDLITYKLQSGMRSMLNKIYPVKVCEVRYLGTEARDKKHVQETVQEAKEEVNEQEAEVNEEAKAEAKEEEAEAQEVNAEAQE